MNPPPDPSDDWSPKDTLERVARAHGRSPEQLRERLRELAEQIGPESQHLSFELLRDFRKRSEQGSLDEVALSHLESCSFCSQLLATLEPSPRHVEEFAAAALARFGALAPEASSATRAEGLPIRIRLSNFLKLAIAASVALMAIGVAPGLHSSRMSASQWVVRFSPELSVRLARDQAWYLIENTCARESGEESGCAYLSTAARFRANGKTHAAHVLLVSGLEQVGVTSLIASKVGETLQTPPSTVLKERQEAAQLARVLVHNTEIPTRWIEAARLQLKAGEQEEALHAVDMYLTAVDTKPAATEAFRAGFIKTAALIESGRMPQSGLAADTPPYSHPPMAAVEDAVPTSTDDR